MVAPAVHPTTQNFYDALGRGFTDRDEQTGWQLLLFCDAVGAILGELDDIIRDSDEGPGWSALLDVDRVPLKFLPFLGQFVGVKVDASLSESDQREQVRTAAGWKRGTPAAILAAVQFRLTGSKKATLIERDTSAYHFKIRTYESETPDPTAVVAAIVSQKPAGLQFVHELLPGDSWLAVKNNFGTWQDVKDTFATWGDVRNWIAP